MYIYNFSYFWLCWVFVAAHSFSLVAVSKGSSLVAVRKLLIAVASPEEEHGLQGTQPPGAPAPGLSSCSLQALESRLGSRGVWA